MKKYVLAIMKKKFIRNVVLVVTGTASAQLVTMLLSPIITRLYGPEAYGHMGVFLAIVGVIAPVAALTYPIAIVLPKKEKGGYKYCQVITVYYSCYSGSDLYAINIF